MIIYPSASHLQSFIAAVSYPIFFILVRNPIKLPFLTFLLGLLKGAKVNTVQTVTLHWKSKQPVNLSLHVHTLATV